MPIIAVALDRVASSLADDVLERFDRLLLRSFRASHVEDFFFHDRAMQVVHAVAERNLRERQAHRNPVGREVVEVIEIDAAHGQIAKLLDRCCRFDVREDRCLRFEGEGNETGEAARFILQFAKLAEVVYALLQRFDMPIKHGTGAATAHLMPDAVDIKPLRGAFLAPAELVADAGIEDLRPPPR